MCVIVCVCVRMCVCARVLVYVFVVLVLLRSDVPLCIMTYSHVRHDMLIRSSTYDVTHSWGT